MDNLWRLTLSLNLETRVIDRLPNEDFVPYAPEDDGEQINIDHESCPEGEDTRKRLYIRRTDDGRILGYCHNCGLSGYHNGGDHQIRNCRTYGTDDDETYGSKLTFSAQIETDINQFPRRARVWLYQYGLTEEEVKTNGIIYDCNMDRVILPIYDISGELVYWQGRSLDLKNNPPKYKNKSLHTRTGVLHYSGSRVADNVCVVEDIISSIIVGRIMPSVALLGTHLDDEMALTLASNFKNINIFLDPDAQMKAVEMAIRLGPLAKGRVRPILGADHDPKEMSDEDLTTLLM